jgi:hypothetical protein
MKEAGEYISRQGIGFLNRFYFICSPPEAGPNIWREIRGLAFI